MLKFKMAEKMATMWHDVAIKSYDCFWKYIVKNLLQFSMSRNIFMKCNDT